LRALPGVRDAAVVALRAEDAVRLVAFVEGAASPNPVRQALASRLPPAMLPSRVLPGPLPRLPSGKVDYPRLSARAGSGGERTGAATGADAPRERTRSEDTPSRIWAHTLGRDDVSVDDDFFALGGDSFLAVKVVGEPHRPLSPVVRLRDLFASPTV